MARELKPLKTENDMMWEILENRDDYGRGFGMRDEAEEAYREGCRHGYEKAIEEMRSGFGQRGGYSGGGSYGNRMGERRMPGMYPESPAFREMPPYEEFGERRYRDSRGRFI